LHSEKKVTIRNKIAQTKADTKKLISSSKTLKRAGLRPNASTGFFFSINHSNSHETMMATATKNSIS
jgi:hypothetical protein